MEGSSGEVSTGAPVTNGASSGYVPSGSEDTSDSSEGRGTAEAKSDNSGDDEELVLNVTIDGERKVIRGTRAEIARKVQLAEASAKRFREAHSLKQEADAVPKKVREAFAKHDWKTLKSIPGFEDFDPDDWAIGRINKLIDEKEMTREQRLEMELKERDRKEAERAEVEEREALEREAEAKLPQYEKMFVDALKLAKIPRTLESVRQMAQYTQASLEAGYDVEAPVLAQHLSEIKRTTDREMFDAMSDAELLHHFDLERVRRIGKLLVRMNRGEQLGGDAPEPRINPVVKEAQQAPGKPRPAPMESARVKEMQLNARRWKI